MTMARPRVPAAAFVVLITLAPLRESDVVASSQAPPASGQFRSTIVLSGSVIQDGTRYLYEISQERASLLPRWDQRAGSEPPLSLGGARRAAEAWLASRAPEVKALDLTSLSFLKTNPAGLWYYRLTFDPLVGGRRLSGGRDFTAVVLLDGSIVEPRVEQAFAATPAAGGGAPPAAAGSAPVRLGPGMTPPQRIKNVDAVYPPEAQSDKVQGIVILESTIGIDGRVTDVRVVRSIPQLDAAAIAAVKQWEYTPTLQNGVPVAIIMTVTVNFTLQ
jgi:TonB family protein